MISGSLRVYLPCEVSDEMMAQTRVLLQAKGLKVSGLRKVKHPAL
jgi:hypothetical protein